MVVGLKGSVVGLSPTWPPPGYATNVVIINQSYAKSDFLEQLMNAAAAAADDEDFLGEKRATYVGN